MTGAELAAVRTAAAAALGDYQRAVLTADMADRALWGSRLADMLQYLLAALDASDSQPGPPATALARDGTAWLTAADVATVRQALFHAAADERVDGADGVAYDSLRFRLGDVR